MSDPIDYDKLAAAIAKGNRGSGGGGRSSEEISFFNKQIGNLGGNTKLAADVFNEFEKKVGSSLGTWQDLSKTGISFGNDIMAMSAAAKGARVGLNEFNDIITENRASLAGWGGSIDKGAKEFARASKLMYDESGQAVDQLRNLGYTNKDLNEILALQMSTIGTSMRAGKEKDELAIKGAMELANEMDLMAKMTGKSREEQMDSAKKLAADQAYQAKIALQTRGMGEKEAAEYKQKMEEQYIKANALGQGQLFKEQFTYGTVQSKEAAMQLAASGQQGLATVEQANLARAAKFKEADAKAAEAQEAAAKNSQDVAHLQMRVISGATGEFGKAVAQNAKDTEAFSKGVESTRKDMEKELGRPVDTAEAKKEFEKIIKKEQEATEGSTKSVVNFDQRMKDVGSALSNSLYLPLTKQAGPALEKFADSVLGAAKSVGKKTGGDAIQAGGKFVEDTVNAAGDKGNEAIFGKKIPSRQGIEKRAAGGPVKEGEPYIVGDGGEPELFVPKTAGDIMPKSKLANQMPDMASLTGGFGDAVKNMPKADPGKIDIKGITGGFGDAVKNMPKADAAKMPGIDLNKILTDIKTTVSKVEISNWPKEITELKKLTPVQTQPAPAASKPTEKPTEKPAEAKKEVKQPQADTAFQEKMLLETRNMNEKDAAEYKKKIAEEYQKAEALGMGQLFKEQFINGKELSKQAQEKIAAATIQSNKDTAVKSAEAESKKAVEKLAKDQPSEPKASGTKSESYKINGKEVDKKQFDQHMEANPQLASLMNMKGLMPSAGGSDQAAGPAGGNAAATMDSIKGLQAQVSKVNEDDWVFKKKTADDLTDRQKSMLKEMSGLTLEQANTQLKAHRERNSAAMEELADITKKTDAIKYQALSSNRALTEKEKAEIEAIEKPLKEKQARESEATKKSADEYAALQMLIEQKQDVEKKAVSEQVATQKAGAKDILQETREAINGQLVITQNGHTQTITLNEREKAMKEQLSSMSLEELQAKSKANKANLEKALEETELIKANGMKIMDIHNKKNIVGTEAAENELKEHNKTINEKFASNKKFFEENTVLEVLMLEKSAAEKKASSEEQLAVEKAAGNDAIEQTRESINEELMVKQKAIDDAQALTKKSEELAKKRESIEERLADRQARVAQLREIAGERDLTEQEKRHLTIAQDGLKRAENNLKRNLEDQAKLDEALGKVKKESNDKELKSVEQQARDKIELAGISNDEELEAAQIDAAAQAKFTHVDKDKIGEDIDSIVPSSAGATDAEMKAVEAQDKIDGAIARQKEAQQKLNDLLTGASEDDAAEQYEIYAKNLSDANENLAKVVDESFGDLIGGLTESGSDFSDNAEKVMSDINDAIPGPTEAEMKLSAARDNVERAIEKQKEAEEKLASLSVDDDDFLDQYEMAAEALREANENVAKAMDESIKAYEETVADAGEGFNDSLTQVSNDINDALPGPTDADMQSITAMDEQDKELEKQQAEQANLDKMNEDIGGDMLANMDTGPKYSEQAAAEKPKDALDRSKISFGKVTGIGKNGMPILAEPKKDDKNLPKVENPDDARENAKFKRQAEESKKAAEDKKKTEEDKKGKPGEKGEAKSLDDVVKTLEKLNTAMEKLIAVNNSNSTLLKDQIKATKSVASAASGNLHGAH